MHFVRIGLDGILLGEFVDILLVVWDNILVICDVFRS